MAHVVLLGDSIFDNAAYTGGEPDVAAQVSDTLPPGCRVTLLARDGAMIDDVARQVQYIPRDATHVIVSMGGNDALASAPLLNRPVDTVAEALLLLAEPVARFEAAYLNATRIILEADLPTTLCTIYNGAFQSGSIQTAISTAARLFNDTIISIARTAGLNVIDLRHICTDPEDYANSIEPSSAGGAKIAGAIAALV
jgi:hypothetical protein